MARNRLRLERLERRHERLRAAAAKRITGVQVWIVSPSGERKLYVPPERENEPAQLFQK